MMLRIMAVALLVSLAINGTSAVYAVGECVVKAIGNSTSSIAGTIRFTQTETGAVTTVFGNLTGLTPYTTYWAKIHEYGDLYSIESLGGCSPNGESAITFYPNTSATETSYTFTTTQATNIELYPTTTSVIGRSCVISEALCVSGEIDYNVLAGGVIGIAQVTNNPAQAYPSSDPVSGFAYLSGTTGTYGDNRNINGTMYFTMLSSGRMSGYFEANGMVPYSVHGLHVHLYGDLSSSDGTSAGLHFNPNAEYHAGPDTSARHEGDMGNVTVNAMGVSSLLRTFNLLSFTQYNYSILGHAIVLHTIRDDGNPEHAWNSTGAAGGRIALGVIGYSARSSPFVATDSTSSTTNWQLAIAYSCMGLGIVIVVGVAFYCCIKRHPSADYHGI